MKREKRRCQVIIHAASYRDGMWPDRPAPQCVGWLGGQPTMVMKGLDGFRAATEGNSTDANHRRGCPSMCGCASSRRNSALSTTRALWTHTRSTETLLTRGTCLCRERVCHKAPPQHGPQLSLHDGTPRVPSHLPLLVEPLGIALRSRGQGRAFWQSDQVPQRLFMRREVNGAG
jgi:hypothetical protein